MPFVWEHDLAILVGWLGFRVLLGVYFQSAQRISIRRSSQNPDLALLFSRTELDDVVERVCKHHSQYGQAFHLSLELVDYLWEITNGHPAGVRAVLDELASSEVCIGWPSRLYFQSTYQAF